jgi:hypothetical protein
MRATTPRPAWLLNPQDVFTTDSLVILVCPNCGQTHMTTFEEVERRQARSVPCESCSELAQLPDPERVMLAQHQPDPEMRPYRDPEATPPPARSRSAQPQARRE